AIFFFSSRRRHTRSKRDWSSDVCSSDLEKIISNGESVPLTLPKENVVKYRLTNESWIAFRPSGTEPKMKIYLGVCADTEKLANEQLTHLEEQINELI